MTERICSTVPGLNTTWLMPTLVELLDQLDGLFELGDAGADHDAVDRRAGLARLLHQPLSADLQLPQVRVEEQRVELDRRGPARAAAVSSSMRSSKISSVTWPPPASSAQCPALAAAATILASTVVGVMPASRIGERPVSRVNLVDSLTEPSGRRDDRRCVARPGRATSGAAPTVNRLRCPPRVAAGTMPMPRPRITGAVSRVRMSPGPRSRIQRAPASCSAVDLVDPVDRADQDGLGQLAGQLGVQADLRGPAADDVDAVGQPRRVEARPRPGPGRRPGAKTAPPRILFLRSASSFSAICSQYSSKRDSCSGVPVMTTERRPLRIDSTGGSTVRTS